MTTLTKSPILFIHGAWHGGWCWEEHFVPFFTGAGYDCHTFDLPMHDHSGKVKGINRLALSDYVEAVKIKVDEIGQPPIIIGHSMGGIILQKYLERYTCTKAILLAPAPPHGVLGTTLKFLAKPYAWLPLITMNLYGLVNTSTKTRWAFFSSNLAEEDVERYANKMCSESFLAFLNMLYPRIKLGYHKSTPMLVVAGELDNIFSVRDNKQTALKYEADFVTIEGIGHDMMLDIGHERVAEVILNYLK